MRLIWSQRARRDLVEIGRHIRRDNPEAASRWIENLRQRARQATTHPKVGRIVPEVGQDDLRELIHGNYRIVYRIGDGAIEVVTVFEGHRQLPQDP